MDRKPISRRHFIESSAAGMAAYNFRQNDQLQIKRAIANAASAGLGIIAIKVIRGELAEGEKPITPRASLKWVLQDPNVHATVPGFSTFDEMNIDLSVMEDLRLTDAEKEDLKRAASMPGFYCQGCGRCLAQCPARLPIPDLMRAYMYAYGYRQPALAQSHVASLDLPHQTCEDCSFCTVVCQNHWNVGEKVRDIVRFEQVALMTAVLFLATPGGTVPDSQTSQPPVLTPHEISVLKSTAAAV